MPNQNLDFARCAEESAGTFLQGKGYRIIKRNYKNRMGEIDIIAQDKDTLCFIEVKARRSLKYGLPFEAVGALKQAKLSRAALVYLKENKKLDSRARFDVLSMDCSGAKAQFELIRNAFELSGHFTY